ncbi:unnamed protein product [Orchesella dallaii]|uniref:SCP domain-containing protein n=1 Tax=Orchesella dallaii TaxID=48710 RepID=A0ABP1RF53_9HEXA
MGFKQRGRLFLLLGFLISSASAQYGEVTHGRDVVTKVVRALCWYEFMDKIETNVNNFLRCDNQVQKIKTGYEGAPDVVFGGALASSLPQWFPNHVRECDIFLKAPKRQFKGGIKKTNYGFVIGEHFNQPYPFQSFAHCLVAEVDKTDGSTAMLALESRLKSERYWRETMFRRENEFRTLHNVSNLELDTLLTEDAQLYAEQLARTCSFKPSNPMGRDRLYDRQFTGENIAMNGGAFLRDEDSANVAVTGWYEENKNYDFATGASKGNLPVDQFTQSVWKSSKKVGYGMATNKKCPNGYTHYIVARYFPAGNLPNAYLENVFPAINSQ